MFNLTDAQLSEVRRILSEHIGKDGVLVFGSRVKGTDRHYSDLDLAVPGPLEFSKLGRLQDAFEFSELPFRVDVVDMEAVSPKFKEVLLKDGVLFPL